MYLLSDVADWISRTDNRISRRVNRAKPPRWLRYLIVWASRGGDGWLWYAVGLAVLLKGGESRLQAFLAALAAAIAGVCIFTVLKHRIGRPRPKHPHVWRGLHNIAEYIPAWAPDRFSFPSGHSITAFAVAGALAVFYPHGAPVFAGAASAIAVSRVLLGLHYPSDVLAGSAIGGALGLVSGLLARGL